jgi:outer membrane protein assembly factor BamB
LRQARRDKPPAGREGYFYALDAKTGNELWKKTPGGSIMMAAVTFQIDGKQYLSVVSGNSPMTFGLRQ